jgi:hypothetical protein
VSIVGNVGVCAPREDNVVIVVVIAFNVGNVVRASRVCNVVTIVIVCAQLWRDCYCVRPVAARLLLCAPSGGESVIVCAQ